MHPGQVCHLLVDAVLADAQSPIIRIEFALESNRDQPFQPELDRITQLRRELGDHGTDSACSFELASFWLHQCQSTHQYCRRVQSSRLPSRVLDVGTSVDSSEPFLYESKHEAGTYVTLSHCWGHSPISKTTVANLQDRKKSISMSTLQKTLRDAVTITRKFGIQYLWIDSLCIVQDSKEDWEAHSAHMCTIYRNAEFAIAAGYAVDSSGGCFSEREGLLCQPHLFARYESPGTTSAWLARLQPSKPIVSDSPLVHRAWIYQEEMLSPRMLYYDIDGIRWHCITAKGDERYPDLSLGSDSTSNFQRSFLSHLLLEDSENESSDEVDEEWLESPARMGRISLDPQDPIDKAVPVNRSVNTDWHQIIEEYSSRDLTRGTDRLAALLGIAEAVECKSGFKYVAGLWEESLYLDLLWSIAPDAHVNDQITRLDQPIAPSWSWASVTRPVCYPNSSDFPIRNVENVAVQVDGSPSCVAGTVQFRASTREAFTFRKDDGSHGLAVETENGLQGVSNIIWRPDEALANNTKLIVAEIARFYSSDLKQQTQTCNTVYALALVPVTTGFRRVGLVIWPGILFNWPTDIPQTPGCLDFDRNVYGNIRSIDKLYENTKLLPSPLHVKGEDILWPYIHTDVTII